MKINTVYIHTLLSISTLFSCSSSTVVADERKPAQDIFANKISAALTPVVW